MFDSASRFQLVDVAQRNPGVDLFTKSPNGPFIDTGFDLNKFDSVFAEANYARVYVSLDTLREMAEGAGLFDELRAQIEDRETTARNLGYAEALKENLSGHISDFVDRLGELHARLDSGPDAPVLEGVEEPEADEPLVLVIDGDDWPRADRDAPADDDEAGGGADEAAADAVGSGRQGNGARRNRRSNRISAGAGDGNPFRI